MMMEEMLGHQTLPVANLFAGQPSNLCMDEPDQDRG